MGTRIDLPNGQWADFCEVDDVSERRMRTVRAAIAKLPKAAIDVLTAAEKGEITKMQMGVELTPHLDAMYELNDSMTLALVTGWSFGSEVTMDALLDLPKVTYRALQEASAPYLKELVLDDTPVDPTQPENRTHPT